MQLLYTFHIFRFLRVNFDYNLKKHLKNRNDYGIIPLNNYFHLPRSDYMALFGDKDKKNNLIKLQNIVLNINEKKLEVSEEFLEKMTKIYISKYMKAVNDNVSELNKVASAVTLFSRYEFALANIDELIKIEPLYHFSKPTPSEYKAQLESSLPDFVSAFISRSWKKVCPQADIKGIGDSFLEKKYRGFFETFIPVEDKLPPRCVDMLDSLYVNVFPSELNGRPKKPFRPAAGAAAPVAEASAEADAGFVPMTFETIASDESAPQEQ